MDEINDNIRASLNEAIDAEFFRHDERAEGEPITAFDIGEYTLNFQPETITLPNENEDTDDQVEKNTSAVKEFCRMCLCDNRKLQTISPQNRVAFQCVLRNDVSQRTGRSLPQKVCWECNARMTSFTVFRTKAIQTDTLLYSLIRPFMNVDEQTASARAHRSETVGVIDESIPGRPHRLSFCVLQRPGRLHPEEIQEPRQPE